MFFNNIIPIDVKKLTYFRMASIPKCVRKVADFGIGEIIEINIGDRRSIYIWQRRLEYALFVEKQKIKF